MSLSVASIKDFAPSAALVNNSTASLASSLLQKQVPLLQNCFQETEASASYFKISLVHIFLQCNKVEKKIFTCKDIVPISNLLQVQSLKVKPCIQNITRNLHLI
jgi:hypothetical protein